jgi:Na+-driven multidrug efflux pump
MVLHIGVSGAALATILGQSVSAGMSVYFFFFRRNRSYHIKTTYFKPDWSIIREVLMIGLPSFLKSISAGLVVIITNNLLKLIGGDSALGVFAIISRLYSALSTPQTGIVQGMQPLVGYNFGQKRFDRVRKTIALSLSATVIYGILACSICLLIPGILIALLSRESLIVTQGQSALRFLSLAYPVSGVGLMVAAYFQSVGRAKEALVLTLGGTLFVKLPVLLLASRLFALNGIWASEAASELVLCVLALMMLRNYQGKAYLEWSPEQV